MGKKKHYDIDELKEYFKGRHKPEYVNVTKDSECNEILTRDELKPLENSPVTTKPKSQTKLCDMLRTLMSSNNIKQVKLFGKLDITQYELSHIVNDRRQPMAPKIIVGISKFFNVDEDEVLEAALYSRTEELRRKYKLERKNYER